MSDPAYRDHLASLRAQLVAKEAELAARSARLRGLRRFTLSPGLLGPLPAGEVRDDALADRLRHVEARAHDVEVALAATDDLLARLGFPGVTLQEETLGDRPVARERVAARVGQEATIELRERATIARFRRGGTPFTLAVGDARGALRARLAVSVPRGLPPVVGWPDEGIPFDDDVVLLPRGLRRLDGDFWMSHGRAVVAYVGDLLPEPAVLYLSALRAAIDGAW